MIRLIMFDLDGTLVDSSVDITNALNHAVAPLGIGPLTVRETVSMVGEGLTRLLEKAVGEGNAAEVPKVQERYLSYYSLHLTDYTRPYPGVSETLERMPGYIKAVISNKREALSRRLLDELGLSDFFDAVLGSDSVEEKKPSPRPIRYLLERFSVRPEEAVMVGDSNFDIEAGKAAGVRTIAVTYGFRETSCLGNADILVSSFGALLPIVAAESG